MREEIPLSTPKCRVLILSTVGGVGGASKVVATLARGMRQLGVSTRLVFPDPPSKATTEAIAWLRSEAVEAEASPDLPAWNGSHGFRAMARLRKFVRSSGAEATYLHYGSNQIAFRDVIAVRAARTGRCVVMVHHAVPIRGWRPRLMTRVGAGLAQRVVVSTPVMAELLTGIGVPRSKIAVIPLGVSPPGHTPTRAEARSMLSLPPDAFVVATVARLDKGKNVPHLVRCVATLVANGLDAHLLVAGLGEDFDHISRLIANAIPGRGHMLGRVDAIDDVYAAADVFALPSAEEGFGLVFLEAAWHGVPSVAYAVGGVPYAIAHEVTGLLVDPGDENEFAVQLRRLAENSRLRVALGTAARHRVENKFSERLQAERHLDQLLPGWRES